MIGPDPSISSDQACVAKTPRRPCLELDKSSIRRKQTGNDYMDVV